MPRTRLVDCLPVCVRTARLVYPRPSAATTARQPTPGRSTHLDAQPRRRRPRRSSPIPDPGLPPSASSFSGRLVLALPLFIFFSLYLPNPTQPNPNPNQLSFFSLLLPTYPTPSHTTKPQPLSCPFVSVFLTTLSRSCEGVVRNRAACGEKKRKDPRAQQTRAIVVWEGDAPVTRDRRDAGQPPRRRTPGSTRAGASTMRLVKEQSQRVTVDGAIHGDYVLEEERPDGTSCCDPHRTPPSSRTYPGRAATDAEFARFESEHGPFLPPDGEGALAPPASPGRSYPTRLLPTPHDVPATPGDPLGPEPVGRDQ